MPELAEDPVNREPEVENLIQSFITGDEAYERNHSLHPNIAASQHRVRVDGDVNTPLELTIDGLKTEFEQHSIVCALQCAGNRRHTMRTKMKEVQGIDWFDGAVMNCKWTGPRLKDILERAGIDLSSTNKNSAHVAFSCFAEPCQEDTWYGASVPLERALRADMDIILALERNDQPLSAAHGYPVRIITPGVAGARSVKWLDRITVQNFECQNHYMRFDYKVLPKEAVDAQSAKGFWDHVPPIQEMPVNSIIAVPKSGSTVTRYSNGTVTVKGYALPSGEGGPIVKVEVSGDSGLTWSEATLLHDREESKWSWILWQHDVKVDVGSGRSIYSRATDAAGNTQPPQSQWNLRGVCYNGYGNAEDLSII